MPALAMTMSMPPNRSIALRRRRLHGGQVAHVGDDGEHAVPAERAGEFGQRGFVEVGEDQLGALGVQPAGHLGADAACTTGDEDRLSGHRSH